MNLFKKKNDRKRKRILQGKTSSRFFVAMITFFLFAGLPGVAKAQSEIVVKGTVRDKADALVGVSVQVQGSNTGTVTDFDGSYSITVPSKNSVLIFTYVGYLKQTQTVGNRTTIDVLMAEDSKLLEEVVVVGYGTMKKSDLTGAVASVNSDVIARAIPTTVDQALQGHVAGVDIQQNSGMPGASTSIRVRGINSLSSSNEPIYVIDGIIIDGGGTDNTGNTNALANINPADIVSIDILKDASATAIYGSRGANGVIIITTKRGQKGESNVSYNGYVGWQTIPKKLDLLNLQQYAIQRNVLADNGIIATHNNSFVRPDLLGQGTDWQDELFKTALMQSHNVNISGGSDKITYALGAGYLNQEGIAAGSGFKRLNLTGNFDSQVKSWLKAGVNFAFANTNQNVTVSDQSLVLLAMRMTPDVPVRNIDGSFAGYQDQQFMPVNPMALASMVQNENEIADIRANTYAEATIIPGLTLRTELSFDNNTFNNSYFMPTYYLSMYQQNTTNNGKQIKQYNKYWSWRNIATYNKTFGVNTITAMLGQEMSKSTWDYLQGSRNGFPTNTSTGLQLGDPLTSQATGYDGMSALSSFFGRLFYSYNDRYLITATLRRDGSSKFAPDERWGWFPSAAFAWRLSNESFLKDNPVINNLKLRLGYGLVGNQNIPTNQAYVAAYNTSASMWGTGLIASNVPNPDLTWETTSSGNVGVDLGLFKNRIEFVGDVYYKKTKNLLMQASLPDFAGTSGQGALGAPWVNLGSIQNKGIELTLNTVNITNKEFTWNSNLVFSMNRNKVLSINTVTGVLDAVANGNEWGLTESTVINRTMVGRPFGEFYGYKVIGRFEKATDFYMVNDKGDIVRTPVMSGLAIDKTAGVWIGDLIYKDVNGDGVIDQNDRTIIGNPEPKFTFGFGNTFSYKGFDLSIQLAGVYGNDVINYAERFMGNPSRNTSNLFTSALNYAQIAIINPNGPDDYRNTQIVGGDPRSPRMPLGANTSNYDYAFSDRFIQDGSYLRIQNISFGYNLPHSVISKAGIQALKIYTNIQNLYTFTKYKGYDPEVGMTWMNGNAVYGFDDGRYPSPRIYTVGLNVTF